MKNVVNDRQCGFVQGTVVLMADGRLKPIEKIRPGDQVMSFRTDDAASELEPMPVLDTTSYITRDVIEVKSDEDAVMVARGQLFLSPSADWQNAVETAHITDRYGNPKSFTIEKINVGKQKMFDIIVDKNHSLIANGFRVHNSLGGSATSPDGSTGGNSSGPVGSQGGSVDGPAPSNAANMNSGYQGTKSSGPTKDSSTSKDATPAGNPPGGGSCFDPFARVTLADGNHMHIHEIAVGDRVMNKEGSSNTVIGMEVVRLADRKMYSINGGYCFVSEEHPILSQDGWAAFDPTSWAVEDEFRGKLAKITVGSKLMLQDGSFETVETFTEVSKDEDYVIYNLLLDGDHTYVVEGYVVHNKADSPIYSNNANNAGRRSGNGTKSKSKPKEKAPPPPSDEALAYAALQSLTDIMDYICDLMIGYYDKNYFTVRTAVFEYMAYADALASDSLVRANKSSKVSKADKNNLALYNADIVQIHTIIRNSWSYPNQVAVNLESVTRACLNNKQFVDRSQQVLGKYVGTNRSTLDYTIPGMPRPGKVNLPDRPQSVQYVQTAPGQYVTTQPSSDGNTVTPPLTGGLGAPYYRYRVVRGYMYGYEKSKGWKKIGPADQWKDHY